MTARSTLAILASITVLFAAGCGSDDAVKGSGTADIKSDPDVSTGDINIDPDTTDTVEADTAKPEDTTDTADTGVDAEDVADTSTTDASTCPNGDGCACTSNGDCDSGVCLDTHEGKLCASKCTDTCAPGYACKDIGDGDPLFYCVSTQVSLCAPCKFDSECKVNGIDSLCVNYGAEGSFCGAPCTADADCPSNYECADAKEGATVKQCKRKAEGASPATCECSDWAKAKGLETECALSNEFGTCKASRKCGDGGLSECTAKTPASEVCNQLDDDCDGETDNLPAELGCTAKTFEQSGSMTDCKSDGDCKTAGEACDPAAGKCKVLIGACPGKPKCGADGKLECTEAKVASAEVCNGEDDDCDGVNDEGFEFDDNGTKIAVGEACGAGACAGGTVVCSADKTTSTCTSSDKSTKETCDAIDNDCNGKTDDAACDDGDACTIDACDSDKKTCSNTPGADCNDNNDCTKDSCDTASGTCKNEPTTGSCDDGDQCTVGDTCGTDAGGKAICEAGKDQKDCDDKNPCTDDACTKADGCTHTPNSGEVECYTGPKDTAGVGLCKKGKQFCKDGKMLAACEGEVVPAASEACDSVDDDCDGKTDEGCKPTEVAVTFAAARVQGKSGKFDLEMLVGRGSPAGAAPAAQGGKTSAEFGFYAWLQALLK